MIGYLNIWLPRRAVIGWLSNLITIENRDWLSKYWIIRENCDWSVVMSNNSVTTYQTYSNGSVSQDGMYALYFNFFNAWKLGMY